MFVKNIQGQKKTNIQTTKTTKSAQFSMQYDLTDVKTKKMHEKMPRKNYDR